jgi:hypothetical protein
VWPRGSATVAEHVAQRQVQRERQHFLPTERLVAARPGASGPQYDSGQLQNQQADFAPLWILTAHGSKAVAWPSLKNGWHSIHAGSP